MIKTEIGVAEVHLICTRHQIEIRDLTFITGSFGKKIFSINQEYLLRVSDTSMASEQEKFGRVPALDFVPKIIHVGTLERETAPVFYTLLTYVPGDDFVNVYHETTEAQQKQLGEDVAGFLDTLHRISGTHYDIGLYVPALPPFSGTWRAGHEAYWECLKHGAEQLHVQQGSQQIFERAYRYLQANSASLDYQTGPTLLHNDFHPRNILLHRGKFSGAIDWECSQYGEGDFELCHLIHWCLYPPKPDIDFRGFLRAFFEASSKCAQVPDLAQRLTIYQIEHEIQQIIWSGGGAESMRVPRLVRWMDGGVEELFREITAS